MNFCSEIRRAEINEKKKNEISDRIVMGPSYSEIEWKIGKKMEFIKSRKIQKTIRRIPDETSCGIHRSNGHQLLHHSIVSQE